MAATSVHVHKGNSHIFLPLQEALRDHQGGLTQASFKLLLLPWIPAHMGFCVHKEKKNRGEVSIFHSPLALLKVSPIGLQTKPSKGSSSWCRTPRLKIMMWSLNPSLLVEDHSSCNYPPHLRAAHPWIWVLTIYHLHSSTLSHCGSFFSVFSYRKHFLLFWSYQ